jgi:hypothetical protein
MCGDTYLWPESGRFTCHKCCAELVYGGSEEYPDAPCVAIVPDGYNLASMPYKEPSTYEEEMELDDMEEA